MLNNYDQIYTSCSGREYHVDGSKSKKVLKKGTVRKPRGKMAGHSIKRGRAKFAEKGGIRMRQSKADSGKMNEDTETADKASISHLKTDEKREKVELPKCKRTFTCIMYIS